MKSFFLYLKYLKDVQFQLIIAILAGIIFGLATGGGIPVVLGLVYPVLFEDRNMQMVISVMILVITIAGIRASCNFINSYYVAYVGQHVLEKIRVLVFEKIQKLQLSFFNKYTPADLITRAMSDTSVLQMALMEFTQDVIKAPATLLGSIISVSYICYTQTDAFYLLILLLVIPISILPIRVIGLKLRKKAHQMQGESAKMVHRFCQNLSALQEVRAFCMEEYEKERYQKGCKDLFYRFMKVVKYNIILSPIIEIVAAMGIVAAIYYALRQNIPVKVFMSTLAAMYVSYEPLKRIGRLSNELHRAQASLERIHALLDEPIQIRDPEEGVSVGRFKGTVVFKDLNFSYDDITPVLKNVNEVLERGRTYALVGPSGAGKTTFANLIPRFFEAQSGSITIDGIDIRQMRLKDLRQNIGYVGQDPTLFNDTIYNNIRIGKLDASLEEVHEAAKKAFAHDFITLLPKGYHTDVGEDGSLLSGGQKQRIAVARAFLKDAPVLILDEATSALDASSEQFIQQALEKLMSGKTVIIIAHRFSTIKHANQVLVFDKGCIVQRGTHEELMAQKGLYSALYQQQMKPLDYVTEERGVQEQLSVPI